ALNPVLFLYLPAFINLFGMFSDIDAGDRPKILALLFALFPIFNPIIVIYFTEEYKRVIFNRRQSSSIVLALLLVFFPIFNPIIVIYFTEDYKRFIFNRDLSSSI
ncbi:hypothetical protein PMAYCL1PPCAC_15330, partial [Pristionchus mayeri]